jgi:hypothetical protein
MTTQRTKRANTETNEKKDKKPTILHMPKWNHLHLIIQFREEGIAGNQPPDGQIERYSKLLATGASNEVKMQLQEEGMVDTETIENYIKNCTSTLLVDENGFFIRENQIIGMLCMCGSRAKWTTERRGMKSTLVQGTTRVYPSKIYLKNGKIGKVTRGINLPTGGAIKSAQTLSGMDPIEFTISWLDNRDITCDDMKGLLALGQEIGLGGDRRFGYGRYDILEIKKVKTNGNNGGAS